MADLKLLPGGHHGSAVGVNDKGVVVGVSGTIDDTNHAVLWREGQIMDLGTLGGWNSEASAVNRHGVVVGWSETRAGRPSAIHAVRWDDGQMTDLATLGGTRSFATAINDDGWIVGFSSTADELMHAFVWEDGRMTDLGTLVPGAYQSARAHGVDNHGRIVGQATVDNMNTVPVMWENGRIRQLTDRYGCANAINSRGQVTGCLSTGSESFLWTQDHLTVIGPIDGEMYIQAQGIDREGRVVGSTGSRAFIWHSGRIEWLPGLTTGNSSAAGISDQGGLVVGGSAGPPDGRTAHPMVWRRR